MASFDPCNQSHLVRKGFVVVIVLFTYSGELIISHVHVR